MQYMSRNNRFRCCTVFKVRLRCRCVAVEEGWPHCGIASEVSASVMELAFDDLDAPVERVTGVEVPMPYAANLEAAALPSVDDVVAAARKVCGK